MSRTETSNALAWDAANAAAMIVPRQVAGVMRTCAIAAGDDGRGGEHECDQQRQPVADRRDLAVEGFRDHDGNAADHRGDRRPGARRHVFPEHYPADQRRDQRHAGLHQKNVGDRRVAKRHDERARGGGKADRHRDAGQAHAGNQLDSVPRKPSRQTMKAMRKAAAQNDRQNTTVQLSRRVDEAGDRAAEAPEDRRQGRPARSRCARRAPKPPRTRRRHGLFARLTHDAYGRQSVPAAELLAGSQSARTIQCRSVWRGPAPQSGCGNRAAGCPIARFTGRRRTVARWCAAAALRSHLRHMRPGRTRRRIAALSAAREFLIDHRPYQHLFHHTASLFKFIIEKIAADFRA